MNSFINILTIFLIYSFFGWCIESIYKSILEKRLVNSGFLYGPYCPIYGCGAILMYVFLNDISNKPVIAFCLGFVILSVLEYIVGLFMEKAFHRKYWDYSDNKFNLQGRVCLKNSIYWGILSVFFIEFIHPTTLHFLSNINEDAIKNVDIIIFSFFLIDTIVSIRSNFNILTRIQYIEELNNNIRDKIYEIKQKEKTVEQSLQDALDELKLRRAKIIRKAYKTGLRLKKAFPSMKSEELTNFLNEKKDFFKK